MKSNYVHLIIILVLIARTTMAQNEYSITFSKLLFDTTEFRTLIDIDNDSLKLEAIKFLLKVKGDTDVNTEWYGYTNSKIQMDYAAGWSLFNRRFMYATNQFIALYLISAIYYSDSQFCDFIEVIYRGKDGNEMTTRNVEGKFFKKGQTKVKCGKIVYFKYRIVDRRVIRQMFSYYEDWYLELEKKGFKEVSAPMMYKPIEWHKN